MKLLLAPHNDDECLFCSYTIMRCRPEVYIVTDCNRRLSNGVTPKQRQHESIEALSVLGVAPHFFNIKDDELTHDNLKAKLQIMRPSIIFAPALQNGNNEHDIVSEIATELWGDNVIYYATYDKESLTPKGNIEILPTKEEMCLKNEALSKYESQLLHNKQHFDAVMNKSEFFIW